jgi:hypothetical protein
MENKINSKLSEEFKKASLIDYKIVQLTKNSDGWSVKKSGSKKAIIANANAFDALKAAFNVKSANRIVIRAVDVSELKESFAALSKNVSTINYLSNSLSVKKSSGKSKTIKASYIEIPIVNTSNITNKNIK